MVSSAPDREEDSESPPKEPGERAVRVDSVRMDRFERAVDPCNEPPRKVSRGSISARAKPKRRERFP